MGGNPHAGNGNRSGRRDDHQHRNRLARSAGADHRHVGTQQRVRGHQQRGGPAREHPRGGLQPDQHAAVRRTDPGRRCGAADLDGPAAAERPRLGAQGTARRRRRDQHLHRLQPGLPGPRVRAQNRVVPAESTSRARNHVGTGQDPDDQADRGRRRRTGRPGCGRHRRRARARRDAVRGRRPHRRPIRPGAKDSRQGRVQRDAPVLHHDAGQTPCGRPAEHPGVGRRTVRLRRRHPRHRRRAAHAGDPGHRPPDGAVVRGGTDRSGGRQAGGRDRRRRNRFRRQRIPHRR